MKIGMLVNELAVSGGYQKLVLRLTRELLQLGHEVMIYTLVADRGSCYPGEWPEVTVVSPDAPTPDTAGRLELGRMIAEDLDALIVHDEVSFSALLAYEGQARVVWMLNNELDWLKEGLSFRWLVGTVRAATRRRNLSALKRTLKDERDRCRARAVARKVDAYAVYDEHNAAEVQRHFGRNATVVYAGADVEDFEQIAARRHPQQTSQFSVLSVGVLFRHRRYEDVIDATARLSETVDIRLTIVGLHSFAPDYARFLHERVASLSQQERVQFCEYLAPDQLQQLYAEADAFVFVNDGLTWGISVFEAFAAGVPVVISQTVGAVDLIHDGEHGWVVPARAPTELATALMDIHDHPVRAKRLTEAAKTELLDLVRWPAYAVRIERLLS